MRKDIRAVLYTLAVFLLCLLAACGTNDSNEITTIGQLNSPECKIGVSTDTAEDRLVARELPNAQIEYVKDSVSAYEAVRQGKLDAFVYDKLEMEAALWARPGRRETPGRDPGRGK